MSHSVELRHDSVIITIIDEPSGSFVGDMMHSLDEAIRLLDEQPEPVYLIVDFGRAHLSLDDHMKASSMLARGPKPIAHHPKNRENLFVVADPMMKMAIKGLSSDAFGLVRLSEFDTLDEALSYCNGGLGQREAAIDNRPA